MRMVAGIAFAVLCFAGAGIGAVVLTSSKQATPPATIAGSQASVGHNASPTATALATAQPTATPIPANVAAAGQEYLAAIAPLNAALNSFNAAWNAARSQPCSCPQGQFDATPAMAQVSSIVKAYVSLHGVLTHLKAEVPQFANDIDVVDRDDQSVETAFSYANLQFSANNTTPITDELVGISNQLAASKPDIAKLRADLGLPPPGA